VSAIEPLFTQLQFCMKRIAVLGDASEKNVTNLDTAWNCSRIRLSSSCGEMPSLVVGSCLPPSSG
jgi:hypothetical protein